MASPLSGIPTESLAALAAELDLSLIALALSDYGEVEKAGGAPAARAEAALESDLAGGLTSAWTQAASSAVPPALEQLMAGDLNKERINAFVKTLGYRLQTPLKPAQVAVLAGKVKGIYKIAQQHAASRMRATADFAARDARAAVAIGGTQAMWVGGFYSAELSGRIKAVSQDVLLDSGYGHAQAGAELRKALELEFGVRPGGRSEFAPAYPARYAGNPDLYFRQVASVSSHQAHVYGRVSAFSQAGATQYRLSNPMDERTGSICRVMAGQVFTVQSASSQIDRMAASPSPDGVRGVQPWMNADELVDGLGASAGRASAGSPEAAAALQGMGVQLPPFHPMCRTEVVLAAYSPTEVRPPAGGFTEPAPAAPAPSPEPSPEPSPSTPAPPEPGTPAAAHPAFPLPLPKSILDNPASLTPEVMDRHWAGRLIESTPMATPEDFEAASAAWVRARDDIKAAAEALFREENAARAAGNKALEREWSDKRLHAVDLHTAYDKEIRATQADGVRALCSPATAAERKRLTNKKQFDPELVDGLKESMPSNVIMALSKLRYRVRLAPPSTRDLSGGAVGVHVHRYLAAPEIKVSNRAKMGALPKAPGALADRAEYAREIVAHETGHAVDIVMFNKRLQDLWKALPKEHVSWYADTKVVEDVAESIGLGLTETKYKAELERRAPRRMALVRAIFKSEETVRKSAVIISKFSDRLPGYGADETIAKLLALVK